MAGGDRRKCKCCLKLFRGILQRDSNAPSPTASASPSPASRSRIACTISGWPAAAGSMCGCDRKEFVGIETLGRLAFGAFDLGLFQSSREPIKQIQHTCNLGAYFCIDAHSGCLDEPRYHPRRRTAGVPPGDFETAIARDRCLTSTSPPSSKLTINPS